MPAFVPSLELSIDIQGSAELLARRLDAYDAAVTQEIEQAQLDVAYQVYDLSQVYVPVETGALKASGTVQEFSTQAVLGRKRPAGGRYAPTASTFGVQVVYGEGPSSEYAVIVHEDLEAFHEPPTQAKFLERAVNEVAPQMAQQIGDGIVRATKALQL